MRLVLSAFLVYIFLLTPSLLKAQVTSAQDNTATAPTIDKKSYGLIKYKMDSVLYIMLDEYKDLEKTIKGIEQEQSQDLSVEDKKMLDREYEITNSRLKLLTELRKQGINLQLDLSYNRKSYMMGLACVQFLREEFNVNVFPYIASSESTSSTSSVLVDKEQDPTVPVSYVDILAESKPQYSFAIEPEWKKLPVSCNFSTNGYDFNSKRTTISLKYDYLFSYTHPKLKQFYKDKDALIADVALVQINKDYYLNLKVKISSKDANRSYGKIENSAVIVFELIDEKKEFGRAINQIVGIYDPITQVTTYDIFYEIDKHTLNSLSKKELSSIGIFWSSGYELYNIYEVEVLMNQATCLKKQS